VATPAPPQLPAGERLRRAGVAAWSIIGILILVAVFVWLLFKVSVIFAPLGLALVIIYTLNPLITRLERLRIPRALGTIGTYVLVLGTLTLAIIALIPVVSTQVENFSEDWPQFRLEMVRTVDDAAVEIEDRFGTNIDTTQVSCLLLPSEQLGGPDAPTVAECDEVTRDFRDRVTEQAGRLVEFGSSALEVLLVLVLGPLIALYLLIDLPQLRRDFVNVIPEVHREEFLDVGSKLGRAVGGFFRGQLLVALIVGVLSSLGFWLIGLPFWLIIGALAGLTNLIPLVGPFIGGGLGFIVGAISEGFGLGLWAVLVALVVQQLDNHLISPKVMQRTVNLHAATVMLALLAGGTLAGIWGVLLAVPTVAVVKIVAIHLWATRVLGTEVSPYGKPRPKKA
jgi:predicted PurR-regulated permease PerM